MTPTRSEKVPLAPTLGELDERAVRAWTEPMAVTPIGGGCYLVESQRDHEYTVDVPGQRCTCPDHQYRGAQCKHLRRVAIEISRDRVPPPGKRLADCAHCHRDSFVPETADPPLCDDCRLEPGDRVVDRETGNRLSVRDVATERADAYDIQATGSTVADYGTNEGYPAHDLVVEAVYVTDERRREDPKTYAFPYSRLRRDGGHPAS